MQISRRLAQINGASDDDGWGLFNRARTLVSQGVSIVDLSIGEHDIGTDRLILDAMAQSALDGNTGYAAIPGIMALRKEIATRIETRTSVPTSVDNIIVTAGGQAALFAAHMAVCDPGDQALYIDPFYATYPSTIRSVGALPKVVAANADDGFQPDASELDAAAKGARSLLINSPNNPTGVVYGDQTLTGIADVAIKNDLWVISDEVYDTQVWEGDHVSIRSLPKMAQRTVVVGSMSKSHAMTGSRIGWICAPVDVANAISDLSTNTNYGVSGFTQDAALFALRQGDDLERRIAEPFLRRRNMAMAMLGQQNLIRVVPPSGAMYLMLDIRATGLSGEEFGEKLLDEERIAIMPGESFGNAAAGHIRVAMTAADEALLDAIKRLIDFARRMT